MYPVGSFKFCPFCGQKTIGHITDSAHKCAECDKVFIVSRPGARIYEKIIRWLEGKDPSRNELNPRGNMIPRNFNPPIIVKNGEEYEVDKGGA